MQTIAYNTSKGAVINFTRALGCEWGKYNITVNAICPGFFPSKMTAGTLKNLGEDKLAAHAPLKRLGDDEDLKGITLLYASDAGKHITGQTLPVDGGVSALGEVEASNFRLETAEIPAIADGQILIRNHYLSLDPYMRGRMSDAK
eukprot:gene3764-4701_t